MENQDLPIEPITTLERPKKRFTESDETIGESEDEEFDCVGKTRQIFKSIYKAARSLFGLILIFLLYSIIGAWVFMAIESRNEQHYKVNIRDERATVIETMLAESTKLTPLTNATMEKWKTKVEEALLKYEETIRDAVKNNIVSDSEIEVWTIWSSLFFVFTVYTTIGKKLVLFEMIVSFKNVK